MKGVVIVNSASDIAFVWTDDQLKHHFIKVASEHGESGIGFDGELDANFLLQFLSPLVASQRALLAYDGGCYSYKSIICENGFIFTLTMCDDHVYLAINGDGSESEVFLQRKLVALHRIITFLLGPILDELKPSMSLRAERWNMIGRLLDTWCHLYGREQSFLVEAMEWLHVNQTLSRKCVVDLDSSMRSLKPADKHVVHSLLFVDSKLLAFYSNNGATSLDTSNTQMIITLVNTIFPNKDSNNDNSSVPNTATDFSIKKEQEQRQQQQHQAVGSDVDVNHTASNDIPNPIQTIDSFNVLPCGRDVEPVLRPADSDASFRPVSSFDTLSIVSSVVGISASLTPTGCEASGSEDEGQSVTELNRDESTNELSRQSWGSEDKCRSSDAGESNSSFQIGKGDMSQSRHSMQQALSGANQSCTSFDFGEVETGPLDCTTGPVSFGKNESRNSFPVGGEPISQSFHSSGLVSCGVFPSDDCYIRMVVFLQQRAHRLVPHVLHCVRVMTGITLVLVSQIHHTIHAEALLTLLDAVQVLLNPSSSSSSTSSRKTLADRVQIIDSCIKSMADVPKCYGNAVKELWSNVVGRWNEINTKELLKELNLLNNNNSSNNNSSRSFGASRNGITATAHLSASFESSLRALGGSALNLFRALFYVPRAMSADRQQLLTSCIDRVQHKLRLSLIDYREFLLTRSQNNYPFTSYPHDFPGLVHFLYIDRTSNKMIAPSLSPTALSLESAAATQESTTTDADGKRHIDALKSNVWRLLEKMYTNLSFGFTSSAIKIIPYYYTYSLWFEDIMGNQLSVEMPFNGSMTSSSGDEDLAPSQGFHRRLIRQCFPSSSIIKSSLCCYELLCVHDATLPSSVINEQCRHLAARLLAQDESPSRITIF